MGVNLKGITIFHDRNWISNENVCLSRIVLGAKVRDSKYFIEVCVVRRNGRVLIHPI